MTGWALAGLSREGNPPRGGKYRVWVDCPQCGPTAGGFSKYSAQKYGGATQRCPSCWKVFASVRTVRGEIRPDEACGDACKFARGESCSCSCGGAAHGTKRTNPGTRASRGVGLLHHYVSRRINPGSAIAVEHPVITEVADLYASLPDVSRTPEGVQAFRILTDWVARLFATIRIPVRFVEYDPYPDAATMSDRVLRERVLLISTVGNEHPFLSPEQNLVGRAVHDLIVHVVCGCPFTGYGEFNAFEAQAALFPLSVRWVLFSEIVGQACYFLSRGEFPVQKVVRFPRNVERKCRVLRRKFQGTGLRQLVELGILSPEVFALAAQTQYRERGGKANNPPRERRLSDVELDGLRALRRLRREASAGAPGSRARLEREKRRRGLPSAAGAKKLDARARKLARIEFRGVGVEEAARRIFSTLSPIEVAYAGDPARGFYRGFPALHDLFDANELVLGVGGYPDEPDDGRPSGGWRRWLVWSNAVESRVGELIREAWDPDPRLLRAVLPRRGGRLAWEAPSAERFVPRLNAAQRELLGVLRGLLPPGEGS